MWCRLELNLTVIIGFMLQSSTFQKSGQRLVEVLNLNFLRLGGLLSCIGYESSLYLSID